MTLLSLEEIQNYFIDGKYAESTTTQTIITPIDEIITEPLDFSTNVIYENDLTKYNGKKAHIHDLSGPFKYAEIITNFLHKWIDDPENKINEVSKIIAGKTNYKAFMQNLKRMYVFFYRLAKKTYDENKLEIDHAGMGTLKGKEQQKQTENEDKQGIKGETQDKGRTTETETETETETNGKTETETETETETNGKTEMNGKIEMDKKTNINPWYQMLLEYLETYQAETDYNTRIKLPHIRHGDFIDIESYRGTGLYMIYLTPKSRKNPDHESISMESYEVLPTLGDFGHILPEPGFSLVKEHGLAYFRGTEISNFQISNMRKIQLKIDQGEGESEYYDVHFNKPVYFESSLDMELDSEEMDEVIIDGVYLYGYLTETFI